MTNRCDHGMGFGKVTTFYVKYYGKPPAHKTLMEAKKDEAGLTVHRHVHMNGSTHFFKTENMSLSFALSECTAKRTNTMALVVILPYTLQGNIGIIRYTYTFPQNPHFQ